MRVLDLFCGRGGWSKPFIQDGDEVWGIDIKNYGYPGNLILGDIRELDGYGFSDMDLIIGSPPCTEFSIAKEFGKYGKGRKRDIEKGMELIREFKRFVRQAKPDYWAMENVSNLEQWYEPLPIWRFKISKGGRRSLWGNLPIPLSPEFKFQRDIWKTIRDPAKRAEIPFPIARFIADTVKSVLASHGS